MILSAREPLHHRGVQGTRRLLTPAIYDITATVKLTAAKGLVGTVYGAAGTGKTFAVHTAVNAIGAYACRVEFFGTTTQKQIVSTLLLTLAGETPPGNQQLLEQLLLDYLRANKTLIVVD